MKIKITFLLALILSALYPALAQPAARPAWDPKKTWAFFVGLVEWKDPAEFAPFPQKGRQDDVLLTLLKQRGVPEVHYYGYPEEDDEWVTAKMIRQAKAARYAVGQKVEVEWKKEWYPAKILRVKGGSHCITYTGYGKEWNEWVSSKRIRRIK